MTSQASVVDSEPNWPQNREKHEEVKPNHLQDSYRVHTGFLSFISDTKRGLRTSYRTAGREGQFPEAFLCDLAKDIYFSFFAETK